MSKGWKDTDPQAAEEAERYASPIPSRLFIMEFLDARGAPASHKALCKELTITEPEQQEALLFRLKAMIRDGQLLENRKGGYGLLSKMDLIKGRVQGNKDGYGFLIPDDGSEDLYLSWREMRQLFDGDRAVVRETGVDRRGRREGQVIEVIERNTTQLVGRYYEESGSNLVVPENNRIGREIIVKPGPIMPSQGQYVLLEILEQPGRRSQPVGLIKQILGDQQDAGMEVDVAVHTHNIPREWPPEVEEQITRFSTEVAERDKKHRVDLREVPFVTIDGEDARDFDDAVYCETKKSGGWRLFVAIADVSHYVRPGSALDKEAENRGTSVYFPGTVIPMLPEVLSNGLCSLNPEVDRLAMICEMTISSLGKISGYRFYEGLIRSHARLTYTQVWSMLEQPLSDEGKAVRRQRQPLVPHIEELYRLFTVFRQVRADRGTIDFETVETQILFGRNRKIDKIVPAQRNDAHKIIEECMLSANVCAARFLEKHGIPGLYRVHEGPTLEKRLNLNLFLGSLGLSIPQGKIKPADLQVLLESVKDRPDYQVIQTMVLRSMSQAVYTADNQGHFGLAFNAYAHFTSPIRRYPDLLVHRALRHVIRSSIPSRHVTRLDAREMNKKTIYPYDESQIQALGEHCSATERRADEATRDAMDWLKCEYMQQHIGATYRGVVSAVTGFGLFVALEDIFVEGLVHVTSLPGDYYHYDNVHQCLRGERSGRRFGLGDELDIIVSNVNMEYKKIDFELAEGVSLKPRKKRGTQKSKGTAGKALNNVAKSRAAKKALMDAAKEEQKGRKSPGKKAGKKPKTARRPKNSGETSTGSTFQKPKGRKPRKRKISRS